MLKNRGYMIINFTTRIIIDQKKENCPAHIARTTTDKTKE